MATKRKVPVKKSIGVCPSDGTPLEFIGSAGIVDPDHRWEAETDRWRCDNGHMLFVADREPIEEAEMLCADCCKKCGSDIDKNGRCPDVTCPYHERSQEVDLDEMEEAHG